MDLLHRKKQSYKFSNKNGLFCTWRDFNKTFCGVPTYHKWMFKLQISSMFNFDRAHQSWISGLVGVFIWQYKINIVLFYSRILLFLALRSQLFPTAERDCSNRRNPQSWRFPHAQRCVLSPYRLMPIHLSI